MFGHLSLAHLPPLAASSFLVALVALVALAMLARFGLGAGRPATGSPLPEPEPAVFLFDGMRGLVDSTAAARALLGGGNGGSEWQRLLTWLAGHFPQIGELVDRFDAGSDVETAAGSGDGIRLRMEHQVDFMRVTLIGGQVPAEAAPLDALARRAQEEELSSLREILNAEATLIWRCSATNEIIWANDAYMEECARRLGIGRDELVWPLPRIFGPDALVAGTSARIRTKGEPLQWYDCRVLESGAGLLCLASSADAIVRAERTRNEFIQTLTKTFAELPTGLAIFDAGRRLVLFNPALADLTTIDPAFLLSRPTLMSFLNRLREARMIPEPRDFHAWRESMIELERAAAAGRYEEIWQISATLTYRVSGRPHPEGAVALLFEDISAGTATARDLRADLALDSEMMDLGDEAVCVISAAGKVIRGNAAFQRLWGGSPVTWNAPESLSTAMARWQAMTEATPVWDELERILADGCTREEWTEVVRLRAGKTLLCRAVPMRNAATFLSFRPVTANATPLRRLRRVRRGAMQPALVQ